MQSWAVQIHLKRKHWDSSAEQGRSSKRCTDIYERQMSDASGNKRQASSSVGQPAPSSKGEKGRRGSEAVQRLRAQQATQAEKLAQVNKIADTVCLSLDRPQKCAKGPSLEKFQGGLSHACLFPDVTIHDATLPHRDPCTRHGMKDFTEAVGSTCCCCAGAGAGAGNRGIQIEQETRHVWKGIFQDIEATGKEGGGCSSHRSMRSSALLS